MGEHHLKLSQALADKMSSLASKTEFAACFLLAQAASSQVALVETAVSQGQGESTQVFTAIMDRLKKSEDLIMNLQRELSLANATAP
jgi:precorrin-6B methylase 2